MSKSFLVGCLSILTFILIILAYNAPGVYAIGHAVGCLVCSFTAFVLVVWYKTMQ